jgi:hypothetical protein
MSNPHDEQVNIIVNGRRKQVPGPTISFEQVVIEAFGEPKPNTVYTVTYKAGPPENREGSLSAGDKPVDIKNGMVFNVTATDKS